MKDFPTQILQLIQLVSEFAALTNRKLLGLKVTSVWAVLLTSTLLTIDAVWLHLYDENSYFFHFHLVLSYFASDIKHAATGAHSKKCMQMDTLLVERKDTNRFLHQTSPAHSSLPLARTDAIIAEEGGILIA